MQRLGRTRLLPLLLAGAAVLWADTGQARAEILLTLAGPPTSNGTGGFTFTYDVRLSGGFELDTAGGGINSANFFTLYDIPGYIPGSAKSNIASFAQSGVSEQFVGVTPALQSPPDSPTVTNVTFRYTLGTETNNPVGSPEMLLGTVSIDSTTGAVGAPILYSAAAQKNTPGLPEDEEGANDTSFVAGPTAIPAPASLLILGSGLPLLGAAAAFRRRRKQLLSLA